MKPKFRIVVWIIALGLLWAPGTFGQTALPTFNAGFDVTGFIEAAYLNTNPRHGVDPAMRGGRIRVNGKVIVVPDNTIVQMPAAAFTWAQLFDPAVIAPVYGADVTPTPPARPLPPPGKTGLALIDPIKNHYPSYMIRVVGNILTDPVSGAQTYIAGLIVPMEQQALNGQSGYINYIDYGTGRFRVGGAMGNPADGTLCELNDPEGRFGKVHSPDPRFQVDWNNPTVTTATGYPCGIPAVEPIMGLNGFPVPGQQGDPDRPYYNRPPNGGAFGTDPFLPAGAPIKAFTMPPAAAPNSPGVTTPDPWKQIPLMVGDWVDISGTFMKVDPSGATSLEKFLSVHTLTAHLGIKTTPNTNPAYVRVEGFAFGVGDASGGPTVGGIDQETATHVVLVMFTTDTMNLARKAAYPARILGIDANPDTGVETELQFPNGNGATNPEFQIDDIVRGRVRWTPSKNPANPVPGLLGNAVGARKFYREYIVKLNGTGRQVQLPEQANGLPGLIAGQYRLPIFDYIFGEGTTFGQPWPPFNFQDLGYLLEGQGPTGPGGVNVGPLKPFPAFQ